MSVNLVQLLYLVSGVLFILALRGLSSPQTSRRGNRSAWSAWRSPSSPRWPSPRRPASRAGSSSSSASASAAASARVIARRVAMTAMPQLVAAFHSCVGLAAVLVAAAALYAPAAFGIGEPGIDPRRLAGRDVARRRHRRDHLHRLGDRLRQAQRQHVGQADPAAEPPPDQSSALAVAARAADHRLRRQREPCPVLADRARGARCSAA